MRYLDAISPEAERIGAVNCVRRMADGRLMGYNTDIIGLRASFDKLLGATPIEHALVLGTGGASQAVQYALMEREIPYALVSRDAAKGEYTYDNLPTEVVAASKLIINATPVGTFPNVDEAPEIPYHLLDESHALFDLVYNPPVTQFLARGAERGAQTVNGQLMLERQAERAWAIWNE
jgi:shikimate dehydrogenase